MKIVKDGLYMYNDGEAFFIVKADGNIDQYEPSFSGTIAYSQWEEYEVGHYGEDWAIYKFKRLDNKHTTKIEE